MTSTPNTTGVTYNGGQVFNLNATWNRQDTPPVGVTFYDGTNAIGAANLNAPPANFSISGSALGPGNHSFKASAIETAVPAAVLAGPVDGGNCVIDLTAPSITIQVDAGTTVISGLAPGNVCRFTVTSTKPLRQPPTVVILPGDLPATAVGTPVVPGTTFQYTFTNSAGLPSGQYTIRATGKDTTEPEPTANQGTGQAAFAVDADGPQPPAITVSNPIGPISNQNFSLSGTCANDCASITVRDDTGAVFGTTPAGGNWQVSVSGIQEGRRTMTVQGADRFGNVSANSAPFTVVVDLTAPDVPALITPKTPTSATSCTIEGTGAIDNNSGAPGANSPPVSVALLRDGTTQVASVTAGTDGKFTFFNVPLTPNTRNNFIAIAQDSANPRGNRSAFSPMISIEQDSTLPPEPRLSISRGTALASSSVPLDAWLCAGNYSLQVTFNKQMATDTNPTIAWQPANGAEFTNAQGSWTDPYNFVGHVDIPSGQGTTVDGPATYIRISGAKDIAGNVMQPFTPNGVPFRIDTTAPVSRFDQTDTLYVPASQNTVFLSGHSTDAGSGIGYVRLRIEPFDNPTNPTFATVPVFINPPPADVAWNHNLNVTGFNGRYKVFVIAADQARPTPNEEQIVNTNYRLMIVDRTGPTIARISLDDMVQDINNFPPPFVVASDITRITAVASTTGSSGIDFARIGSTTFVLRGPNGNQILGNYTNNGIDTAFFNFPVLNQTGTYTIDLDLWDKAGNQAAHASRTFQIKKIGPQMVRTIPRDKMYCNKTNIALDRSEVWAYIEVATGVPDPAVDWSSSTISVTYNGVEVGVATTAYDNHLTWLLYNGSLTGSDTQLQNGRYNVTVVPVDIYGNVGRAFNSSFYYDSQAPCVVANEPAYTSGNPMGSNWIGLSRNHVEFGFSDRPQDITKFTDHGTANDPAWQNASGSGCYFQVGSLTYTFANESGVETEVQYTASYTGSLGMRGTWHYPDENNKSVASFVHHIDPAIVGTHTSGVATFTYSLCVRDGVVSGEPNFATYTFRFLYDYKAPTITLNPATGTTKYCGTRVSITGSAADSGGGLIDTIEANAGSGYTVIQSSLNVGSLTWTTSSPLNIDISGAREGPASISVKAIDKGGNEGFATFSITIDRTGPQPPTLILPTNNSVAGSRGMRFRCNTPTDTTRWLFQLSDNQGFTNVLNDVQGDKFVGDVTSQPEAAFSVPRDGVYYWRVAGIEDCADGYNIGSWSATWRFTVDTVKPQVLEVSPSPSQGNKITTGMVTFTIRFSESMDTTIVPTVSITSAGGQYMKLEQISYRDNTWTGTTVIPKDNSALYDGNATIAITGAKDMAGTMMEDDATHYVVINTGPTFETLLFSNPAHENEVMVIVRATENLQAPPTCSITQGTSPVPVTMHFLKERYYAGAYTIDLEHPGKAYIDLTGTDLAGMVGHASVQFTVADLNPSAALRVASVDGKAVLDVPAGALAKRSGLFVLPRQPGVASATDASRRAAILKAVMPATPSNTELVNLCTLETFGPSSLRFAKKAQFSAVVPDGSLRGHDPKQVGVYRQVGDKWEYLGGQVRGRLVTASVDAVGPMALMADTVKPRMLSMRPSDQELLEDPRPVFEGQFVDNGAGLDGASFSVYVDGNKQTGGTLTANDGVFTWQPAQPLSKGKHNVQFAVADRAGNVLNASFQVVAPGPFNIDQLVAYPNPSRGEYIYITYDLQQPADEIRMKIYDVRGHKVAEYDDFAFTGRARGKLRWDLRNDDGERVANGVYLYKLEATRNGETLKATGKLAVLR